MTFVSFESASAEPLMEIWNLREAITVWVWDEGEEGTASAPPLFSFKTGLDSGGRWMGCRVQSYIAH